MEISHKIKNAGLKLTPQRRAVYGLMQELSHSSVDEIIAKMKTHYPQMTVSTIYRILDSFCQVGLVSKFINSSGKTIFDITPEEHYHIFSVDNAIIDVEDKQMTEMIRKRIQGKIPEHEEIDQISICITTKKHREDGKEIVNIGKRSSDC